MSSFVPVNRQRLGLASLPGYREQLRDVASQAKASLARSEGQLAESQMRLGATAAAVAGDAATKAVQEQETAALNKAYAELGQARLNLLEDPKAGFLTQRQKVALDNVKSVMSAFDASAEAINRNLTPAQQERFKEAVTKERLAFQAVVGRHARQEGEALSASTYEAALASDASRVVSSIAAGSAWGKGSLAAAMVQDGIDSGLARIDERAVQQGWSPEVKQQMRGQFLTGTHLAAVDRLLGMKDVRGAQAYFEATRPVMDAATVAKSRVEEIIAKAVRNQDAFQTAHDFLVVNGDDPAAALADLSEAEITDGEKYNAIQDQILRFAAQKDQAQRLRDSPKVGAILLGMEQAIDQNRLRTFRPEAEDGWERLSPESQQKILGEVNQARRMQASEGRAWRAERNRQQGELMNRFLAFYEPGQDLTELDRPEGMDGPTWALTLKAARKMNDSDEKQEAGSAGEVRNIAHEFLTQNGVQYDANKDSQYSKVMGKVMAHWSRTQDPTERTPEKMEKVLKGAFKDHLIPDSGYVWDDTKPWATLTKAEKLRSIPADIRQEIQERMAEVGAEMTDDAMLDAYESYLFSEGE